MRLERLYRFQAPSGFRDEQRRQTLETQAPGRGTEKNIRAFRVAMAGHEPLRRYFLRYQCARSGQELRRRELGMMEEIEEEDAFPSILEDPGILEDPDFWRGTDDDLW